MTLFAGFTQYLYWGKEEVSKATHLSQVELEYVAYVVRIKLRELHQVLAILKRLAQLLHPRLGAIHAVDPLHSTKTKCIQVIHRKMRRNFQGSPWQNQLTTLQNINKTQQRHTANAASKQVVVLWVKELH